MSPATTPTSAFRRGSTVAAACMLLVLCAGCSQQEADWRTARGADSVAAYEDYLRAYPGGSHAADAEARLKSLREEREWERAARLNTPEAYQRYLGSYPEGRFAAESRSRLQDFLLAQVPSTDEAGPAAVPATVPAKAAPAAAEPPKPVAAAVPAPRPDQATGTLAEAAVVSNARIQLGAFANGEPAARRAWESLVTANRDLLGPLRPRIDRISSGGRTLWRLQAGPVTRPRAAEICTALKARGVVCAVAGA